MTAKTAVQSTLKKRHVDLIPIAIQGSLYMLPEAILTNKNFAELKDVIIANSVIRVVAPTELITTFI